MVRLLGYNSRIDLEKDELPREIVKTPNPSGDSGWLIRFFDSAFFCEWIAVSYLYKHEHSGVRDYLCNRMYALPITGIENYLFQLCYMLVHMPSPSLDKYIVDMCSKSLRIAIKVQWFLLAESEDVDDSEHIQRLQDRCQNAALNGDWPPLIKPQKNLFVNSSGKIRMFNKLLSSRRLLPTSSPPHQKVSPLNSSSQAEEGQRDANRSPLEDSDSSLKVLKKFMPGPKVRDAFLKKFREKEEDDIDRPKDAESDSFFRRLFREKDEDERAVRSDEMANSDGFFRRLFRDRNDTDERFGNKGSEEEEKEGFFRKLFRDKGDDRDGRDKLDDDEKVSATWDEDDGPEFFLFRRFFKVHPEEDEKALGGLENFVGGTPENSPGDNFFKRLFRDRSLVEDGKFFGMRRDDGTSPSSFLKRLFKDRGDEDGGPTPEDPVHVTYIVDSLNLTNADPIGDCPKGVQVRVKNGFHEVDHSYQQEVSKLPEPCAVDTHPMSKKVENKDSGYREEHILVEKQLPDCGMCNMPHSPDSPLVANGNLFMKLPGSPLRKLEKPSSKPPLPKQSTFKIRKGTYHATLDFVQSLCDTSSGLVDVFPMEDRRKALLESLGELNSHLVAAEGDGGVCFPMGKGLYRIVHIPEEDSVLLNSREKAPFMMCVELMRCDTQRSDVSKDVKESIPKKRGGIPLANGDVQWQRPPPWAYPNWNQPMQQPNTEQLLRTASKAIDLALAQLWEAKLKVVDVTLSVQRRSVGRPECSVHKPGCDSVSDTEGACTCPNLIEKQSVEEASINDSKRIAVFGEDSQNSVRDLGQGGFRDTDLTPRDLDGMEDSGTESSDLTANRNTQIEEGNSEEWVSVVLTSVVGINLEDVEEEQPAKKREHRRVPSTIAMAEVTAAAAKGEAPPGLPVKKTGPLPAESQSVGRVETNVKATDALAGELWEQKKERIRKSSKFGSHSEWDLRSMIVKSGDDCRQEHLAVQLVAHFYDIFQEAGLPLWLRPYEVLVTSSYTALIETIPDTASIHAIKHRNSNVSSLREFFCNKYIEKSPEFILAQRNFVESMAGYSILCYVLQVKDRHNGNLLLDEEGHIIHIDFGFMLSNSPGGVNFESAPFKLTRELLEVMDSDAEGAPSEFFDYFKVLCIQGFLTCRKQAERIILLVEMMLDSGCPCFKGGPRTIQNLRKRFHLSLTEKQCVSLVLSLINSSLDAWRTRQYDYYQRVLNGIL